MRARQATDSASVGGRILAAVPHVPDGLITVAPASSTPWAERRAVEVELTRKADAEYGRILRWYAAELDYQWVIWFASRDSVRSALARLIECERLDDFMQVQPSPSMAGNSDHACRD